MADETKTQEVLTLDTLMSKGRLVKDDSQKPFARDLVEEFVRQVVQQGQGGGEDVYAFLNQRIQEIDELISLQLNEFMHHDDFKKL